MCSAIALEASLPDWMMMPRRMSITVAWLFSGRYMHDSVLEPRHQAFWLTETRSVCLSLPERSACSTRKLVIILVSDAGGRGSSGLAEASTSPESKSISSQALAGSAGGLPGEAVWAASGAGALTGATAFLWVTGLLAWCTAAKEAVPGSRAPAAMAMRAGIRKSFLGVMAFQAESLIVANRTGDLPTGRKNLTADMASGSSARFKPLPMGALFQVPGPVGHFSVYAQTSAGTRD